MLGTILPETAPAAVSESRDALIVRRATEYGDAFSIIGRDYGISRERVRQIVVAATGRTGSDLIETRNQRRTAAKIATIREAATAHPQASIRDLIDLTGTSRALIAQALDRTEVMRREDPAAYTSLSEDTIFAEMRRIAALPGGSPLTGAFYDEHRNTDSKDASVSATRLVQRHGTWVGACQAAGVPARRPNGDRTYIRRWSTEQMTRTVFDYLNSTTHPTYTGFEVTLKGRQDVPSAQTIRNALGSWAEMKRKAIAAHGRLTD